MFPRRMRQPALDALTQCIFDTMSQDTKPLETYYNLEREAYYASTLILKKPQELSHGFFRNIDRKRIEANPTDSILQWATHVLVY